MISVSSRRFLAQSSQTLRVPSRAVSVDWGSQYRSLPEVKEATFGSKVAVPMMERALDICSGAVPSPLHPLAVHARLGLAAAYASTGDYAGANRALQLKDKDNAWVDTEKLQKGAAEGGAMDEIDPSLVATCARALSISHLMLADAEAAEEAGMRSLELSEQADNALPDTRAIGEALHCVGLARLAAGQEDAVDYL
mmetsp:Transcript_5507/g.10344  ORF Transcript_5507/g.10344 Transcript_5507/m.10344 type:complete len:196 (+) Transcript_5507:57-644(+)